MGKVIIMDKRSQAKRDKDVADVSKLVERLNKKNKHWELSVFFDTAGNIIYGDLHNIREELWDYDSEYQMIIVPGQIQNNDLHNYADAILALYHSENNNTEII
jgi:hypothetical protein